MGLCQAVVRCKISSGHDLNCPGLMAESMDLRKSSLLSMLKVSILTLKLAQFRRNSVLDFTKSQFTGPLFVLTVCFETRARH